MPFRTNRYAVALCVALCTGALAAEVAQAAPAAKPGAPGANRFKGLEITFGFGVSGSTGYLEDLGSGFDLRDELVYIRFHVLYRIMKWFGVGLHWAFPFHDPSGFSGYDINWNMMLGVEARGFFSWRQLDVWTAMAFGYYRDQADNGGSIWSDGFGFGWGFGARYFVWRNLAVGIAFWLYAHAVGQYCNENNPGEACQTSGHGLDETPNGVFWTFGFNATWFIPL